ncbi:MAG: 3-hydroxyacyl-CoA dehydrogenase family protein [Planctomycetia bacterium]|nr:3-hydroxyacyl-CoA dehydrogenase family protein [Planctomycetia bacterium]
MTPKKKQLEPAPIHSVGILGAGLMGVGIAAANARCEVPVRIYDSNPEMLETLKSRLAWELDDLSDPAMLEATLRQVQPSRLEDLAECDLLLEVIPERIDLKAAVYAQMGKLLKPTAIAATNTSTIPLERLAQVFPRPKYFAGLHFLHPVRHRELVEVIPSTQTQEGVLQRLCDHALAIGKTPLCVGDCPGFVVNRLLQPYLNEAMTLLQEGVSMAAIENAAKHFGMAWGPLRIMDEIGLDVVFHSGRVLFEAYPDRVSPSPILITMIKKKLLGRKTGAGFYHWGRDWHEHVNDHRREPSRFCNRAKEIIKMWKNERVEKHSRNELAIRMATAMAMEGGRIIIEDVVGEQGQVDMAAVIGLGFPESKKGPLAWFSKEHTEKKGR